MKTSDRFLVAASAVALLLGSSNSLLLAQTPLNLDTNPSFDFGDDPNQDPLFTPALLGVKGGQPGFAGIDAWRAAGSQISTSFPPAMEIFIAYWGHPGYGLLGGTAQPPAPLSANSQLSMASAFRPSPLWFQGETPSGGAGGAQGAGPLIVGGRNWGGMAAEATRVSLQGVLYELPGATMYVSPLVLDLNQDGLLSASRGLWLPHPAKLTGPYAAFDMDGDGFKDVTEWIGPGDALVCTAPNPQTGRDLLGMAGGWPDGFAHLAQFDLDDNGRVEGAELNGLYAWQDFNTNAVADPGEVVSVQSLGIKWIATSHSNYVSGYGYLNGSGAVWDWWPNYALANRRAIVPAGGAPGLLGSTAIPSLSTIAFAPLGIGRGLIGGLAPRNSIIATGVQAQTSSLSGPVHISPTALAAAGIDVPSFRMLLLADQGRVILGRESGHWGLPIRQPRLLRIRLGSTAGGPLEVAGIVLPFEEIFQVASEPTGNRVLVLGDYGAKLVLVDFDRGSLAPEGGLDLQSIGLRASGIAGHSGGFWFTAWRLDEQGAVIDERVWGITPWGFWGGLSLDASLGPRSSLRSFFLTGPTSGIFALPGPGGTNEQLWSIMGANQTLIDQADNFGGMHAIYTGGAGGAQGAGPCLYTKRDADLFTVALWRPGDGTNSHSIEANRGVINFYPLLSAGGGTAIAANFSPETQTFTYSSASTAAAATNLSPLLVTSPGQGRVAQGAFAHYGPAGMDVIPVPDSSPASNDQVWTYTLLPDSQLWDDCPICGSVVIPQAMEGSFQLRLLEENPLYARYAIENISWQAGSGMGATYRITGSGIYQRGGAVGNLQEISLQVYIDDGFTNQLCYFTNTESAVSRLWPMLQFSVNQTNGTMVQQYHLDLNAAPFHEIWFSTKAPFHAGIWQDPTNFVSAGDLLSSIGRVVKSNQQLTRNLGILPSVPDLGLDGLDVLPAGEIAFSMEQDVFSETLGQLHHGDLLSDQGRIVISSQDLIAAFSPSVLAADAGLDAVQVLSKYEIYFSVSTDFYSMSLKKTIRRGDLLSSTGQVIKTNEQLLARFQPSNPNQDYGLDAVYVWPSGEIWFSTEAGFSGPHFEFYQAGDLLSDQGYVVYRNLQLMSTFAPVEDLSDFGLDSLFVITGTTASAPAPRFDPGQPQRRGNDLLFHWTGQAKVFRLERASDVAGPWAPLSPCLTDQTYEHLQAIATNTTGFYRLRAW